MAWPIMLTENPEMLRQSAAVGKGHQGRSYCAGFDHLIN